MWPRRGPKDLILPHPMNILQQTRLRQILESSPERQRNPDGVSASVEPRAEVPKSSQCQDRIGGLAVVPKVPGNLRQRDRGGQS